MSREAPAFGVAVTGDRHRRVAVPASGMLGRDRLGHEDPLGPAMEERRAQIGDRVRLAAPVLVEDLGRGGTAGEEPLYDGVDVGGRGALAALSVRGSAGTEGVDCYAVPGLQDAAPTRPRSRMSLRISAEPRVSVAASRVPG